MAKISKPFRVAAEGSTTDGRTITRDQISQMAANYNPARYGARLWNNHLRGILPDSLFAAMGDVQKLEAKEFDAEGGSKKLGLYATIAALPNLLNMFSKGSNIYWSIEMAPNFAGSGQAYCVGLAPTDDPASLWTEPAKFAATGALEATRHLYADTLFSTMLQAAPEWEDEAAPNIGADLLTKIKSLFGGAAQTQHDIAKAVEAGFNEVAGKFQGVVANETFNTLKGRVDQLEAAQAQAKAEFAALQTKLSLASDATPPRPPATGSTGTVLTDC
jgi:hypothetical protein